MTDSSAPDKAKVMDTFKEALQYYEKLSETFKVIGKGTDSY